MRRLFVTLIALTLIWCGYWIAGAFAMERGLAAWLEARRAEGWRADVAETSVNGFPFAFTGQIMKVGIADPIGTVGLQADTLEARIPSYWPLSTRISFPETPMTLDTPQGPYFLKLLEGMAEVAVAPSIPPRLSSAFLQSADWQLNAPGGNILSALDQHTTVTQDVGITDRYHITSDVTALAPGDVLRQAIGLPSDWPRVLSEFSIDFSLQLATDQNDESQARLRDLEIRRIDFVWASLSFSATGRINIDATGMPDGNLNLNIKGWREAYEIAKEAGIIRAENHLRYDLVLNGLSNLGGDPNTLDFPVSFRGGQVYLGPIQLGPAPRFHF